MRTCVVLLILIRHDVLMIVNPPIPKRVHRPFLALYHTGRGVTHKLWLPISTTVLHFIQPERVCLRQTKSSYLLSS